MDDLIYEVYYVNNGTKEMIAAFLSDVDAIDYTERKMSISRMSGKPHTYFALDRTTGEVLI